MNDALIPLAILRGCTVIVGTLFLVFTFQAYRKHHAKSMLILAAAIALMVLAVWMEGVAFFLFGAGIGTAEALEAATTLLAFLVLLVSVRAHRA